MIWYFVSTDSPSDSIRNWKTAGLPVNLTLGKHQIPVSLPLELVSGAYPESYPEVKPDSFRVGGVSARLRCKSLGSNPEYNDRYTPLTSSSGNETQIWCFLTGRPAVFALNVETEEQSVRTKYHQSHTLLTSKCEIYKWIWNLNFINPFDVVHDNFAEMKFAKRSPILSFFYNFCNSDRQC